MNLLLRGMKNSRLVAGFGGSTPITPINAMMAVIIFFLVIPTLHPLLRPTLGETSHLLWLLHVLPVTIVAYRSGSKGMMGILILSALIVWFGEALFGRGYWVSAPPEIRWSLVAAVSTTSVLLGGFGLYARYAVSRLHRVAYFDDLTDALNRHGLESELTNHTGSKQEWRIVFFDIDNFKQVNASLGHKIGDSILRILAQRMAEWAPKEAVLARWSGDEFVIAAPKSATDPSEKRWCERIAAEAKKPIDADQISVQLHVNLGVADGDLENPERLLRKGFTALGAAKADQQTYWRVFDSKFIASAEDSITLLNDLRQALDETKIEPHFQGIYDQKTHELRGAEILSRWKHPIRGAVRPDHFIKIAERNGELERLSSQVFSQAMESLESWTKSSILPANFFTTLNLTPGQLLNPNLRDTLLDLVLSRNIQPTNVVLEITEQQMVEEGRGCLETLHALRKDGFRIAIDDFGSGYSSLGYLRRLPADIVKIDRSLVCDPEAKTQGFLNSLTSMCHALDLEVLVEGVETAEQMELVRVAECDWIQGMYLAGPESRQDFSDRLQSGGY